jgi:hypothetical protein
MLSARSVWIGIWQRFEKPNFLKLKLFPQPWFGDCGQYQRSLMNVCFKWLVDTISTSSIQSFVHPADHQIPIRPNWWWNWTCTFIFPWFVYALGLVCVKKIQTYIKTYEPFPNQITRNKSQTLNVPYSDLDDFQCKTFN